MLKLYTVDVWHRSQPGNLETIAVWSYSAERAEHLASESYPGCNAHAARELVDGARHDPFPQRLEGEAGPYK